MNHRLKIVLIAFGVLCVAYAALFLATGWPERSVDSVFAVAGWMFFFFSLLEAVILFIIGLTLSTGRGGAPPGTIGTETPVELPPGYLSRQQKGGSYMMAAGLVLMVGMSMCWGQFML